MNAQKTVMLGLTLTAGVASAKWNDVDISRAPLVQVRRETVAGKAASLLPPGKAWKLVWHDEFDGAAIDRTKWMCRESFWGSDFPAFAHDFEGVEMTGETVRLHLLRKGDDFCSPHLHFVRVYDEGMDGTENENSVRN